MVDEVRSCTSTVVYFMLVVLLCVSLSLLGGRCVVSVALLIEHCSAYGDCMLLQQSC
jgi:hypothetical protein